MADYTVKQIDQMQGGFGGGFKRARAELGVSSFGMQVIDLPPNSGDTYPRHDHGEDGQEEVYLLLSGGGEIEIEGEVLTLDQGEMIRIGPGTTRHVRSGPDGARLLVIGGVPGAVYEPPAYSQLADH